MKTWTNELEEELTLFIKDWLKHAGRSQADLCSFLNAPNTRISSLLEIFKKDFYKGGIAKIAERLCKVELAWSGSKKSKNITAEITDPLGQLDLLLDEIKEDCDI